MKWKMWLILVLTVLTLALWCGTAGAMGIFTTQPTSTFRGSDCSFVISWETDFTPVRVQIVKRVNGGSSEVVADITSASDLRAAMSWPIPAHHDTNNTAYYVYAYSTAGYYPSESFTNDWASVKFTGSPTCSYMQYYQDFQIYFYTSFTPKKSVVTVFYNVVAASETSERNYLFVPLSKATSKDYWLKVYYGDGDQDYIEHGSYYFDWDMVKFNREPTVGVNGAGDKFKVSWETSYVPLTLQLWKHSSSGDTMLEEITEGLNYIMDYELPFTGDASDVNYTVRAYYLPTEYRDSQPFTKDFSVLTFTSQPNNGLVAPSGHARVWWATSFKPTRVEIGYTGTDGFVPRTTISSQLSSSMSYDFGRSDVISAKLAIKAYYSGQRYKVSTPFSLTATEDYYFTVSPPGGVLQPGRTMKLAWTTNYTPASVEIFSRDEGSTSTSLVTKLTTDLASSMSYSLPWENAGLGTGSVIIRAWFNPVSYVDSVCTVQRIPPSFTTLPAGGTVNPGKTLQLSWKTDFTPTRVEIGYLSSGTWTATETIDSDLSQSMGRALPYDKLINGTMGIRAYSGRVCASGEFQVNKIAPAFTFQPSGGTVYPWKPLELRWRCNFTPALVSIGYVQNNSFVEVTTLENPASYGTYTMDYAHAVSSDAWEVRAQYGDEFYPSTRLSIEKRAAYTCGDSVTAIYADGTLSITGTGTMYDYRLGSNPAPWDEIRSLIQHVVIGDGVTTIGQQAFFNCTHLTDLTLPASVTQVGQYAFEYTGLRSVDYGGMRLQWQQIGIGSGNSNLQNASISYLYRSGTVASGVNYTLEGYSGKLIVSGSGGGTVHVTPPWINWAPYITEIEVQGLDTIWEDAFRDCTSVASVYLDDSLTLIDDGAFYECTALTDVYYSGPRVDWDKITISGHNDPIRNAEIHATAHEEQLTGDLSWSVDDAGLLRIWYDDSLMGDGEDTNIPNCSYTSSVSTAPWFAEYASVITSIRVESGVTSIGNNAFAGLNMARTIEIADSVTAIGAAAFIDCSMLEDFTLPDSILSIGNGAFRNCTNLEQVFLPEHVTSLGRWVFRSCSNLVKVRLPSQINAIPNQTFYGCRLLEDVEIPVTVASIGDYSFFNCTGLTTATGHVYYGGTSAQWKQIAISATGNGSLQNAANIHMSPEELRISAANFPDESFRTVVANAFDTDQSGWLTDAELAAVDSFGTEDTDYTTVHGMEYFTEITFLMLDGAPSLTSLDLSANTKLTHVEVFDNALTELNLNNLSQLVELDCDGNALTSLDVSPFDMTKLLCYNNPMASLTLGNQPELGRLFCYGTELITLDLHGCPLLVNCVVNGTRTVTANYVEYKIDNTNILRVDASTELIYPGALPIDAEHFPDAVFRSYVSSYIDLNHSGWLSQTEIVQAGEIVLEAIPGLASLQGMEYLTAVTGLVVGDAPELTSLDLSGNTELTNVDLYRTGLTELNISHLNLESLGVTNSPLTSLTLGSQPSLAILYTQGSELIELDISGCPMLIDAYLHGTQTEADGTVEYTDPVTYNTMKLDSDVRVITGLERVIRFDARGGSPEAEAQTVYSGSTAVEPVAPIKIGAVFTGWYTDETCSAESLFSFDTLITESITLYAGWLLPAPTGILSLPADLTVIEADAFSSVAAEAVIIPGTVTSISGNPFAGSDVRFIYGHAGSAAQTLADSYDDLTFVPISDSWLASH